MWQNSCWMIGTAWKIKEKKVIFICLAQVIIALGQSLVSLFISPAVISAVETQKSLTYLLVTINLHWKNTLKLKQCLITLRES